MKHSCLLLLFTPWLLFGQSAENGESTYSQKEIIISSTNEAIQIDGILNEKIWTQINGFSDFQQHLPVDDKLANQQTEIKLAYDGNFLYIAAIMQDDNGFIIETLKRDRRGESDEFTVYIDPVNNQTHGYSFSINAGGAASEALIANFGLDDSWDNKWFGSAKQHIGSWIVEMAIPFKTLRYKKDISSWGINFHRHDPGGNETSVWQSVPREFDSSDMAYFGQLHWETPPQKQGSNIALIPYISANYNEDGRVDDDGELDVEIGGDAKIALSPTLNLDLTYNPDFSQVEVDRQVTNLTRFNIFFPERRDFFLENADIFNSYGVWIENPFFSRRIGLDPVGQTIPILYGARLSGNLDENWRIGILSMHQKSNALINAQNFAALAFHRRVFKRSLIKGIFLNRQGWADGELSKQDYSRNVGGEFLYSTPDGKWSGLAGYIQSFQPGPKDESAHFYGRLNFTEQRLRAFASFQHMGENYMSDIGFLGRQINFDSENFQLVKIGFTQINTFADYFTYPGKENSKLNFHRTGLENYVYLNDDGSLNEWYTRLRHFFVFKNTSQLNIRVNYNKINLLFPFGITETPLPVDSYEFVELNGQYFTDQRKPLRLEVFSVYGGFYNGSKWTNRINLTIRTQPWGLFSLGLDQNNIWLPDPYGNIDLTLATGRMEFSFSNSLFWTTFLQYNTQADNFNINSRFQWRFAPQSDVYFVYSDNYMVEGMFGPKNRSLVLKVNYWLAL